MHFLMLGVFFICVGVVVGLFPLIIITYPIQVGIDQL